MRISDWSSDVCSSDLSAAMIAAWISARDNCALATATRAPRLPPSSLGIAKPTVDSALRTPRYGPEPMTFSTWPWTTGLGRSPATVRPARAAPTRSEEHTSELQSLMRHSYAVFCWKKKKEQTKTPLSPPNDNKKHKKKHIPHIHTTHNIKHEQTQIVITHQLYSNTHNHHT